jgi:hypothetical protein
MADLAASNVTVTLLKRGRIPGFANVGRVTIAFGNSSLTVPAAGIPLPTVMAKYGVRSRIHFMQVQGPPASGLVWEYDQANHKLLARQSAGFTPSGAVAAPTFNGSELAAHNHNLKVMGGASGGIDEALGVEGTDTLAKDAATDRTIVGADAATKGGVVGGSAGTPAGTISAPAFTGVAVAAAALAAYTGAIAPTVLTAIVYGD